MTDAFNSRATEQLDIIGSKVNDIIKELRSNKSDQVIPEMNGIFDLGAYLDMNEKKFDSWPSYFGPDHDGSFNFTNLGRWDFSNEAVTLNAGGIIVSGFLDLTNIPPQVFKPENICTPD